MICMCLWSFFVGHTVSASAVKQQLVFNQGVSNSLVNLLRDLLHVLKFFLAALIQHINVIAVKHGTIVKLSFADCFNCLT